VSRRGPRPAPPAGARWLRLTKGKYALIDEADYEAVSKLSWHLYTPSKTRKRKTLYARHVSRVPGTNKRKSVYLHRWLWEHWGMPPAEHIDHDGGNGLDCRRSKLRAATHAENQRSRAYKGAGFRGVKRDGNRYVARITVDGKRQVLGRFDDAWTAAQAYDSAAIVLHKAFAWLNFVEALP
jgi:HNH endonuclease